MRKFRTAEEWSIIIKEQSDSGLSVVDFCKDKGIHPNIFYAKRSALKKTNGFVEIRMKSQRNEVKKIIIKIKDVTLELEENIIKTELIDIIRSAREAVNA
jgi:hypothetical protein